MKTSWNAPDGQLWAAEFDNGPDLYQHMTGSWLLEQPGIDPMVARPTVAAISSFRDRFLTGDLAAGRQTVVIRPRVATSTEFSAVLDVFDGSIQEVLKKYHPRYVGAASSRATLGGKKRGTADQWGVKAVANGDSDAFAVLVIFLATLALIIAMVFWGQQIVNVFYGLIKLSMLGFAVWLAIRFRRWMKGEPRKPRRKNFDF